MVEPKVDSMLARIRDHGRSSNTQRDRTKFSRRQVLWLAGGVAVGLGSSACEASWSNSREAPEEREVTFASGPDTIYGSLLLPPAPKSRRLPAALIISGSGAVDRDGNVPIFSDDVVADSRRFAEFNTYLNFARVLAEAGVISLRFDKLGSGRTGLASYTGRTAELGFEALVNTAQAGYDFLRLQPEVDPARMIILGHSEGALIALILADRLQRDAEPAALILAAPPGERVLDVIRRQLHDRFVSSVVEDGPGDSSQATAVAAEIDNLISGLREFGLVPDSVSDPSFREWFGGEQARYWVEADSYDPRAIAASLPATLPVLLLRGSHDIRVGAQDIDNLYAALRESGNMAAAAYELDGVNHNFREVTDEPGSIYDFGDPALVFSREAPQVLHAFLDTQGLLSR